jgi:hypothetical protein
LQQPRFLFYVAIAGILFADPRHSDLPGNSHPFVRIDTSLEELNSINHRSLNVPTGI